MAEGITPTFEHLDSRSGRSVILVYLGTHGMGEKSHCSMNSWPMKKTTQGGT